MSNVTYDAGNLTITLEGLDTVERALGDLKKKTPAAAKVAINATAREARKLMVAQAKARYAVNAAGRKHLKDLVQRKKATNASLSAELHIASMRNDLGYFDTYPKKPLSGGNWKKAPKNGFKARVLKSEPRKTLTGKGKLSKGFLVKFDSRHVGMVERVEGTNALEKSTNRGGDVKESRWRTWDGRVEKVQTLGSPSATAMHNTIWPEVEPSVEEYLHNRLNEQVQKVLARAGKV